MRLLYRTGIVWPGSTFPKLKNGEVSLRSRTKGSPISAWGGENFLLEELIVSTLADTGRHWPTLADTGCTYRRNMSILIISFSIIVYEQAAHANIGYNGGILLLRREGGGWV